MDVENSGPPPTGPAIGGESSRDLFCGARASHTEIYPTNRKDVQGRCGRKMHEDVRTDSLSKWRPEPRRGGKCAMGGDYNPPFLSPTNRLPAPSLSSHSGFTGRVSLVLEKTETQIRFYQALRKDVLLKTCTFTESSKVITELGSSFSYGACC